METKEKAANKHIQLTAKSAASRLGPLQVFAETDHRKTFQSIEQLLEKLKNNPKFLKLDNPGRAGVLRKVAPGIFKEQTTDMLSLPQVPDTEP
ncbi:MAG: hypothetical protein IH977_13870 [Nitrospinae bacterium]|nr:hypothetical protein [Nitrospinota bacterium]